jgi:hypothetical protein
MLDANSLLLYGGAAAGVLLALLALVFLLRPRKTRVDPERGLAEDLSTYPPAPGKPGPLRLTLHGHPVRLRLVVVAPVGKRAIAEGGAVEPLLDRVLRGLGEVARQDKPRVRVWPPQLSNQGFAPAFVRLTNRPDPSGQPSHWVLAAGSVRAAGKPVLLGLALFADGDTNLGNITLNDAQWTEALQIQAGA